MDKFREKNPREERKIRERKSSLFFFFFFFLSFFLSLAKQGDMVGASGLCFAMYGSTIGGSTMDGEPLADDSRARDS